MTSRIMRASLELVMMGQPTSTQLMEAVGRALGKQKREIEGLREQISASATTDRMGSLVQRGLDALEGECLQDGAASFCQVKYQQLLDRVFAEYWYLRSQSHSVEVKTGTGTVAFNERTLYQPDGLRSKLIASVEKVLGEQVTRGRMLKGKVDPSRIAALYKGNPDAILTTNATHLHLLGVAPRLRSFAEGLNDQPLGDLRALHFRLLLETAGALGAPADRIQALTQRMAEVRSKLELASDEWRSCAKQYGHIIPSQISRALNAHSDDALPECTDIQRSYFDQFSCCHRLE